SKGDFLDCDLLYDDSPHQPSKIEEALLSKFEVASQRILEAHILFDQITNTLDLQCQTDNENMSAGNMRVLKDLCEKLTVVAKRHFEAYGRDTLAQRCTDETRDAKTTSKNNNTVKRNSKLSYAQAVNPNTKAIPQNVSLNNNNSSAKG
ncbi:hypothetical protein EPUL_006752, partial [Erysiphe pulchra]